MPCPVFSPTRVAAQSPQQLGRLPLIDAYEGMCTAQPDGYVPGGETLLKRCNHGYSNTSCSRYPAGEELSCLRYSILKRTADSLEVICIEEAAHEPRRWHVFEYLLQAADLRGVVPTECMRAQAIAFCQAYVRRLQSELN